MAGSFHAFGRAEYFRVASEFGKDLLRALLPADRGHSIVFPALRTLRIRGPLSMSGSLWDVVQSFHISRWFSSHPVQKDGYQIVCFHCRDFEWLLDSEASFRERLESEHPEVAQIYERTSSQSFSTFSDGTWRNEYDLRHPYTFESSTTVKLGLRPNRGTDRQRELTIPTKIPTPPILARTSADA
ncbi:hypothetical protein EDB85DRAFT_2159598 [Lactarius pseudohatsudake]|nr:hypothetical protein EDB85DRAFT_2159598 [Lactarius pseudohatsudake]